MELEQAVRFRALLYHIEGVMYQHDRGRLDVELQTYKLLGDLRDRLAIDLRNDDRSGTFGPQRLVFDLQEQLIDNYLQMAAHAPDEVKNG